MTEFGAGVAICLVKFSEHIANQEARRVEKAIKWLNAEPLEREQIMEEEDAEWKLVLAIDDQAPSTEETVEGLLVAWANAASDHLAGLDRESAPESMSELADLMFDLRHPAVDGTYRGEEEWLRVLSLWSAAAMEIDEMLGVEQPDWGEW